MAIVPTGAIYKSLVFDGEDSRNYGVYITGRAVYNAPQRDVEMVEIPGRSGAFALDKGRFENIEVTYPAGIFADNETDFAEAISDFRNFLCSRRGYVRLTDEYNPNEYRMAIYKSGLEVSPAQLKAGEFNIVFDCKPQRWLTSGEDAVDVSDGDTLMNPTLFESSPLIEMDGYGTISFNGYAIEIEDIVVGDVPISSTQTFSNMDVVKEWGDKADMFNAGDEITINNIILRSSMTITTAAVFIPEQGEDDRPMGLIYWDSPNTDAALSYSISGNTVYFTMTIPKITLTIGVDHTLTYKTRATVKVQAPGQTWERTSQYATTTIKYSNGKIKITADRLFLDEGYLPTAGPITQNSITIGEIKGYSTIRVEVGTKYIDCDLGEAYLLGDEDIPLNQHIDLGSNLPKLASGVNIISFDDTLSNMKITPRWWKV